MKLQRRSRSQEGLISFIENQTAGACSLDANQRLGGFVDACTYNEPQRKMCSRMWILHSKWLESVLQWHVPDILALYSKRNDSPKSKNVGLFGEGKLVLFCVRGELLDELGGQVTEPAIGDPQLVFSPAERTTTPCCLILQSHCGSSRRVTTTRWLCIITPAVFRTLRWWCAHATNNKVSAPSFVRH